jgi:membrane-associated phospholipid phosphatase
MNPIYEFGVQFIQALQLLSPAFDGPMKFITFLGTIEFYLLLIPFLYWVVSAPLGMRVLLVLIGTDFLTLGFKQLLRQPRPYWVGQVKPLAEETSYGIPSSHASDSLAVWGYLAYRLKKDWLWALTILVVLLIGLSRMYLGVHFPTDVLAGWLIGLVVIIVFAKSEDRVAAWLGNFSMPGQIGIGFAVSILMILAGWIIGRLIAPYPDPPAWAEYASQARGISHYFTLGGSLFGATLGYALMRQHAAFQARGAWWQRVLRYALGMAVVLAIYLGLDVAFGMIAADQTALGLVLRYTRYAAVTFWVMFGAPWVFLKIRLAEPDSKGSKV